MAVERFNRATVNVGTTETVVLNAHETGDTIVITGRASTTAGTDQTLTLYVNGVPVQTALVPSDDTATLDGDKLVMKAGDVLSAVSTGDVDVYVAALEREGGAGSADAAAVAANTAVQARDVATAKAAEAVSASNNAAASSQSAATSAATALEYATGGLVRVSETDSGLDYFGNKIETVGELSNTIVDYAGNKKVQFSVDLSALPTHADLTTLDTTLRGVIVAESTALSDEISLTEVALASDISTVSGRVDAVEATQVADKAELQGKITEVDNKIAPAVQAGIDSVIGVAPVALDTLAEIAAAINDDANYAATLTAALATKVESSTFTTAIDAKANASDVYTQAETDTAITTSVTATVNAAIDIERATTTGEVANLQTQIDTLSSSVTSLQTQVTAVLDSLSNLQSSINTTNTDLTNNVASLQTQIDAKAPLADPAFTGTVTCTGDIIAFA